MELEAAEVELQKHPSKSAVKVGTNFQKLVELALSAQVSVNSLPSIATVGPKLYVPSV